MEFSKIGKFCPRAGITVYVTPKLIELVEISHAPANFFYFVNQCYVLRVSSWLGWAYSFFNQKWPKIALNGQNSQFFYIDPIWLCLTSSQLIGMCLFFYIKELQVNLLNKNSENGHFQPKMAQKIALNGQNSYFFIYSSNMIMPYEYPVNWDALIHFYQGTTSQFIE